MENQSEELIDNRPSFFKIILPSPLASELLRIPPEFIKHIEKDSSEKATLRGPSGCCWPMKVGEDAKGLFLEDGWHQFFKAHSLGHFEFLVFMYDGEMCFDVRIYDDNGLERVNVTVAIPHQHDNSHESISVQHDSGDEIDRESDEVYNVESHQEAMLINGRRKDQDIRCNSRQLKEFREDKRFQKEIEVYVIELSDEEMDVQFKEYKDEIVNQRNEIKNARKGAYNIKPCQDAILTTVKRKRGRPRKNPVGSNEGPGPQGHESAQLKKSTGKERLKIEMKEEIIQVSNDESDFLFKRFKALKFDRPSSSRRSPPTEVRDGFYRKNGTLGSRFPFFQKCLEARNLKRVYMFAIPLTFARKYLPDEKTRMRLMNKEGDSWDVNFIPSESRPVFCGGWPAFVRENGLKRGDICVFELVQELVMKVYIRKPE